MLVPMLYKVEITVVGIINSKVTTMYYYNIILLVWIYKKKFRGTAKNVFKYHTFWPEIRNGKNFVW